MENREEEKEEREENKKRKTGSRGGEREPRMVAKQAPVNTHIPIATGSWLGPEV